MIAQAREQVLAYPTVTFVQDEAIAVHREGDEHFSVALASGETRTGARLLLAHGVQDVLPEIPGVHERWGKTVFHCPYCHGYELQGGPVAVLAVGPVSMHQAILIPDWGPATFLLNGAFEPDEEQRAQLAARGVAIETTPVARLSGEADVELGDGRRLTFAGL